MITLLMFCLVGFAPPEESPIPTEPTTTPSPPVKEGERSRKRNEPALRRCSKSTLSKS